MCSILDNILTSVVLLFSTEWADQLLNMHDSKLPFAIHNCGVSDPLYKLKEIGPYSLLKYFNGQFALHDAKQRFDSV